MSIRKAVAWLLDVGDGTDADGGPPRVAREETRPHETLERQLYGQAEAIRVLYQTAAPQEGPPKPPRAKKHRRSWAVRYVNSLSSSLCEPVGSEA